VPPRDDPPPPPPDDAPDDEIAGEVVAQLSTEELARLRERFASYLAPWPKIVRLRQQ
jgi:hypothetical protein